MVGFRIDDADRDQCTYSIYLTASKETMVIVRTLSNLLSLRTLRGGRVPDRQR